ncbi:hypothetical protein RHE_CH01858 [Rhizobium etli CFN 42]|uniref:Uncharacterized protein n=1 Tax=Rhizobium etli (strain ATCC 51251 / DSM 11541 / JCM 21823 / NBRC 15573 / CFN 42) TaxID=347834 RepID=Q2K937_RHIEC|nr:hypothetical protein RHE_CH01858 [Rhizobium etli CFN 42]
MKIQWQVIADEILQLADVTLLLGHAIKAGCIVLVSLIAHRLREEYIPDRNMPVRITLVDRIVLGIGIPVVPSPLLRRIPITWRDEPPKCWDRSIWH